MAEITKTSRVELRLTDADKDVFQRAAEQDGRAVAGRGAALEGAELPA